MARNLYADLDQWERRFSYDVDLASAERQELENIIEAASRDCDIFCHTHFYSKLDTVILDGKGEATLIVPDLLVVTSIKLDENRDRAFETTLAVTDYLLQRPFVPAPYDTKPYRRVVMDAVNGDFGRFVAQEQLVEIVAEWGFTNETEDTGQTVQDSVEQDATQTTLLVEDGSKFSVGQTILIDAEQQYVSAAPSTTLTVARGVNGTVAATHANGKTISRYVYTPEVRDACLIQAVRLWKRKETAFVTREPPSGFMGFDADAARLLQPFVRLDQ